VGREEMADGAVGEVCLVEHEQAMSFVEALCWVGDGVKLSIVLYSSCVSENYKIQRICAYSVSLSSPYLWELLDK
jgi:hypothetical protein